MSLKIQEALYQINLKISHIIRFYCPYISLKNKTITKAMLGFL